VNVLIVYAHPEPGSFNGAMLTVAVETLEAAGHQVVVSDLYAMGFQAATTRADFTTTAEAEFFNYQVEERHAVEHDGFAPDIKAEMAKLEAADLLIFQFPIYWFSVPAILKGWVDRVFAMGWAYGGGRYFDQGAFRGKRAMVAMTTGGPAEVFMPDGRFGAMEVVLWPIQHGIFRFCGFDVVEPFVAYAAARVDDEARAAMLEAWRRRLAAIETAPCLAFHDSEDYDDTGRLKPGIAPKTAAQRRRS
jgi:NAD(P)H dehydrogenase (quinone)